MTGAAIPDRTPALGLSDARPLLAAQGVTDPVALIGVRGFFGAMGASPGNDLGVYDDAAFLVTSDACRGFLFNTDPTRVEPPNVMLKPGLWRYHPGQHVPEHGEAYDALVHAGNFVWVSVHPRTLEDYRLFGRLRNVGLQEDLPSVDAYREALRARGARLLTDGSVEWPMSAHINIHRGGSVDTGSRGCQTVHPSVWAEFIDSVYRALRERSQADLPYLLLDAPDLPVAGQAGG